MECKCGSKNFNFKNGRFTCKDCTAIWKIADTGDGYIPYNNIAEELAKKKQWLNHCFCLEYISI